MFIINEHTLERLICCQCKKYLSVKPVKVYPNRGIKCGRCSDDNDAGVVSYFGVLADHSLFPCINRFDGCGQLLRYSEVAHHEEKCMSNEYECPICVSTFKASSYHIYLHFKELHPEAFLFNNPEFTINIDQELYKRYLYCKNNLLFFIVVQYMYAEQLLKFATLFLGQHCDRIMQSFELRSLDRKVKHTSRNKPCSSAMNEGDLEWFQVNLKEKDFEKRMVICRFNLDTEQVEGLQRLPESVKAFNSIFQFQPVKNVKFGTYNPVQTSFSNQTQSPKQTLDISTIWTTPKELTNQTHTTVESLDGSPGTSVGFGHTPTVITTSASLFSNSYTGGTFGTPKVAATTSATTVPSLATTNIPLWLTPASFTSSAFNAASNESSVIPRATTQTSSNVFGHTVGATASSSNRSLFAQSQMKSTFGSSR